MNAATAVALITYNKRGDKHVGVTYSHTSLVSTIAQVCEVDKDLKNTDVVLSTCKMTDVFGLVVTVGMACRAGT